MSVIDDAKQDAMQVEKSDDESPCASTKDYDELVESYNNLLLEYETLKTKRSPSFWLEALNKPEGTKPLKDFIKEISNELFVSWDRLQRGQLKYSLYQSITTIAFLGAILWVAYTLTVQGSLDSSSTTFLLGTITGHFITYTTKQESK